MVESKVIAGKTMLFKPSEPEEGNQPRLREKARISRRPSQKTGIEYL